MKYWHLYDAKALRPVEPRCVDGRTQRDVVKELVEKLESSTNRTAILVMPPGGGKTAIVLSASFEIAGPEGKVVYCSGPYRFRQQQVVHDYGGGKFLIGDGESFWTLAAIYGRQQFTCPRFGCACDAAPCIDPEKRRDLDCYEPPTLQPVDGPIAEWASIDGSTWRLPETPCSYFQQYRAYADANVIVMNSFKWYVETVAYRKVRADVEIIDEFDATLLAIQPRLEITIDQVKTLKKLINLRLSASLRERYLSTIRKVLTLFRKIVSEEDAVLLLQELCDVVNELRLILPGDVIDELSDLLDACRKFLHMKMNLRNYVLVQSRDRVCLVNTNPGTYYRELLLKQCGRYRILLTGTPIPQILLAEIFGLDDVEVIQVGKKLPGTVYLGGTFGLDVSGRLLRLRKEHEERYRQELRNTMRLARTDGYEPRLIVATSKYVLDLFVAEYPSVPVDYDGSKLQEFAEGKLSEVVTTRAFRAVDLPGDKCRSIVILKAPFPDLNDTFWASLRRRFAREGRPEQLFWTIYRGYAKLTLLQIIARGLRGPDDWVWLYSPDSNVLKLLQELEHEDYIETRRIEPPTRKIVLDLLTKIEREGMASIEIPDEDLRAKVKHILEKWFSSIVYEAGTYIVAVHKSRQHELEEAVRKLVQELQSTSTTLSSKSSEDSTSQDDMVLVFFRDDCPPLFRRGDIAFISRRLIEKCSDVDELHLSAM